MNEITVIFPHQLFEKHPGVAQGRPIYLVEEPHFFTRYRFHKQKLQFHKATLLEYYDFLVSKGYTVQYVSLDESLHDLMKSKGIKRIHMSLLYDRVLEESFTKSCSLNGISLQFYDRPYFMTSQRRFEELFAQKQTFYFSSFYQIQRRHFSLLMTPEGKPLGGKFSFDPENRKRIPASENVPQAMVLSTRESMRKAQHWVKRFEDNPGSDDRIGYPVTFSTARE